LLITVQLLRFCTYSDTRLAEAAVPLKVGERQRTTRRRPALPNGRALIGGFLVAVAMVLAFTLASASNHGPRGHMVVARRPIPVGRRIDDEDLRLEPVDVAEPVAGQLFDEIHQVAGSIALAPLAPDDVVNRSTVVTEGGDGPVGREFSFPVDRERALNGRLQPGEWVDVLVTYGTGDSARTLVVAPGVRLIDITEVGKATLGSTGKIVVTLLLTDGDQLVGTAHASEVGAVTLVRSTGASEGKPSEPYLTPGAGR